MQLEQQETFELHGPQLEVFGEIENRLPPPARKRPAAALVLAALALVSVFGIGGAKLKGAGCTQPVFEESAVEAILNAADGTARLISKICNASLVIGNTQELNTITAETVMQAINDSTLG